MFVSVLAVQRERDLRCNNVWGRSCSSASSCRCRLLSEAEPNKRRADLHLAARFRTILDLCPLASSGGGLVHRRERGRKHMLLNGRSCPISQEMGVAGLVGSVCLPLADPGSLRFVKGYNPRSHKGPGGRIGHQFPLPSIKGLGPGG